mmetsp:Transcript_5259/g.5385  ORF Transcript_5259/g.5385 Transcript_5259/m.5385 type:complete len:227 (+) Transcript_5259:283-963(+)
MSIYLYLSLTTIINNSFEFSLILECVIELGAWLGRSSAFIAGVAPNAVVYSIDIWDNAYFTDDQHYGKESMFTEILRAGPIYEQFLRNSWKHKFTGTTVDDCKGIVPLKMKSVDALHLLKSINIQPDIIYVDANHHYEGVLEDVTACVELFPLAEMVGDDWHYEDVRRAVNGVAEKYGKEVFVKGKHCWTFSREACQANPNYGNKPIIKTAKNSGSFASMLNNFKK